MRSLCRLFLGSGEPAPFVAGFRSLLRRKPTPQPIINDRIAEQIGETRTSHE